MSQEKVLLVVIERKFISKITWEDRLEELSELTRSAGGKVVGLVKATVERPAPNFFVRQGKLEEIRLKMVQSRPHLVIFNVDLAPVQARNLERALGTRIVDRTGLILDIFARRAVSRAGRLQVELAQLNYLLPRLIGRGVIMSRLGGGIGTRGPGEQKLEVDRRQIRNRISRIQAELEKLRTHRNLLRAHRRRKLFPVIAIVGYTNAGKSALLNALTGAEALVENKLFATLDPITRRFRTQSGDEFLLTDTVGFLSDLPHALVEAFHATLEEVAEADILIHVLDISNPAQEHQYHTVGQVLEELGAHEKPIVLALNKIDLINEDQLTKFLKQYPDSIPISAKMKLNLDALVEALLRHTRKVGTHEPSHRPSN